MTSPKPPSASWSAQPGSPASRPRVGSAPLADRIGRRRILLAGLAFGVLAHLIFLQGPNPAGLILARLIYGVSWGLMSAAWPPLSVDFAPTSRRGEAIGYTIAATESALLYAPFVLLLIAEAINFRVVYAGLALLFLHRLPYRPHLP